MLCQPIALLGLAIASTALAGPLTPPAGTPASTYKTLDQVEPSIPIDTLTGDGTAAFVITGSGNYHLTRNYFFTSRPAIIRVAASNVTIDLRGFSLNGNGSTDHAIQSNEFNITVRNGSITGTGDTAIEILNDNAVIENISFRNADGLGGTAVDLGNAGTVRNCTFQAGGRIRSGPGSLVAQCTFDNVRESLDLGNGSLATDVTIVGRGTASANTIISLDDGCTLNRVHVTNAFNRIVFGGDGCAIVDSSFANPDTATNTSTGTAIVLSDGALVRGVRLSNVGANGIALNSGIIDSSVVRRVTGTGIDGSDMTIRGCLIERCDVAIDANRSVVTECVIFANSTSLAAVSGSEMLVTDCTVTNNFGDAISLGFNSEARGNRLRINGGGIVATDDARVINNHLDSDVIRVVGSDNVIDGNTITDQANAIDVDGTGNLIIRNRVTGSTANYSIVAGNSVGTIRTTPVGAGPLDNLAF